MCLQLPPCCARGSHPTHVFSLSLQKVALGGYQAATSTKSGAVQELAQQLLTRGAASTGEYAAAVAGLTAADVTAAVGAMLKGPPTLVATGPLSELPKYDAVARRFSS